ncbi:hypothetical protein ACWGSK_01045 [Nocardiopsis sp. NPDC055551]
MDISIRPYSPDDREAVVTLSPRAWEPVHASLAQVLGDTPYGGLVGDRRTTQSRDVRADLDAGEVGVCGRGRGRGRRVRHRRTRPTGEGRGGPLPVVRYFKNL